jgi:hypothetical protein
MPITKNYTSEKKVEAFLGVEIEFGGADNAINEAVNLVDKITGRNFVADSVASARLFSGQAGLDLIIDDCVEITKVEMGSDMYGDSFAEVASTKYIKLPLNYTAKSLPITRLHVKDDYWTSGVANHRITAKWGYSVAVPSAVELATTILAGGVYMFNKGGASGDLNSESIGNYSVSYANAEGWKAYKRAVEILNSFKRFGL